jgi:hypothetical protein
MLLEPHSSYVRKIRVASSTRDSLATRLAIQRVLAGADLYAPSLPRAAILCVRALRNRSRRLSLRADRDFSALELWRQETIEALDDLARRAVRPIREPVPGNAEAVLFANYTELLACLALDWSRGRLAEHWWWTGLFVSKPYPSWAAVWLEKPEFIPAAVELLAEQLEVESLARNVASAEARQLLAAVVERFGLREIAAVLSLAEVEAATAGSRLSQQITPPSGDEELLAPGMASAQVPVLAMPIRPPWQRCVEETELPADLGVQEQAWLGIALVLQRAPRWARSAEFAERIHKWILATQGIPKSRLGAAKDEPVVHRTDGPIREQRAQMYGPSDAVRTSEERFAPGDVRSVAGPPAMATPSADALGRADSDVPINRIDAEPLSSIIAPRDAQPSSLPTPRNEFLAATYPPSSSEPVRRPSQPREREIETNFGGVFYLLNAALQLGLYGDFTIPMQPGLALPVGDFLALVGGELAGPDFAGDPLWHLLAEFDGRGDDEAPGAQFDPPDRWQVPPDWLTGFPEPSVWHWSAHTGRMRIEHPEGFTILDLPANSETADAQLRSATEAYASFPFELRSDPLTPGPSRVQGLGANSQLSTLNSQLAPLQRWLDWLCGYLRARLARALGFPASSTAALTLLLQQPARVQTTSTHVRVFFSLAQHPLEIRVAGLDRDPGWVPAAGRNFAFYYE